MTTPPYYTLFTCEEREQIKKIFDSVKDIMKKNEEILREMPYYEYLKLFFVYLSKDIPKDKNQR